MIAEIILKVKPFFRLPVKRMPESNAPDFQTMSDSLLGMEKAPANEITEGRYTVRFAQTTKEIDAALRLRFEVFNLELKEGLETSYLTARDEDEFDWSCHHLIVVENETGSVIGTYRLLTLETAKDASGFYSANEFQLEDLPPEILAESLEIGRACIAREHRNSRVLFLLWKGLAMYATLKGKNYLFGCCSLSSQDEREGIQVMEQLMRGGYCHSDLKVAPRAALACRAANFPAQSFSEEIELPRLFGTYLRIGAKICGAPVLDRHFKTIDFFVIFDVKAIDQRYYKMFFAPFENLAPNSKQKFEFL